MSAVKTILEFSLPCVVAITKADILPDPEARRGAISQQLLEAGLVTEEFGGDVPVSDSYVSGVIRVCVFDLI